MRNYCSMAVGFHTSLPLAVEVYIHMVAPFSVFCLFLASSLTTNDSLILQTIFFLSVSFSFSFSFSFFPLPLLFPSHSSLHLHLSTKSEALSQTSALSSPSCWSIYHLSLLLLFSLTGVMGFGLLGVCLRFGLLVLLFEFWVESVWVSGYCWCLFEFWC